MFSTLLSWCCDAQTCASGDFQKNRGLQVSLTLSDGITRYQRPVLSGVLC